MVKLPKIILEIMIKAAREKSPEEICGLVGGVKENGDKIIKEIYVLENMEHSGKHFAIDPKEQLKAVKDMRKKGLLPLGNFHSHPESPSSPSKEDIRLAYDKKASYLILSLMDIENPVLSSFHIEDGISIEEPVEYI